MQRSLKLLAWPNSRDAADWRAEAPGFRHDARRPQVPSVQQRIDMAALGRQALRRLPAEVDGQPRLARPSYGPDAIEVLLGQLLVSARHLRCAIIKDDPS